MSSALVIEWARACTCMRVCSSLCSSLYISQAADVLRRYDVNAKDGTLDLFEFDRLVRDLNKFQGGTGAAAGAGTAHADPRIHDAFIKFDTDRSVSWKPRGAAVERAGERDCHEGGRPGWRQRRRSGGRQGERKRLRLEAAGR